MKSAMPVLGHFEIIQPPFKRPQAELIAWTSRCHVEASRAQSEASRALSEASRALPENRASEADLTEERIDKLFRRYSVSSEKIATRSFECPDIQSFESWSNNVIYKTTAAHPEGVGIRDRAQFFSERAQNVFQSFYPATEKLPDHLIHVTCTGYVSPSAAQLRAAGSDNVAVTHAYHMGCYAAIPAVRMAEAFVKASDSSQFSADIVHTEMCGLHMNAADNTPEQIVVQTLFADGHIKYTVGHESRFKKGFRVLRVLEEIVPDSAEDMSWIPSSWGMQMTLSRSVPDKIAANLRPFLSKLIAGQDQNLSEILKTALFAVHPGGPKIIESVRTTLEITDGQTAASDKILLNRGNMSSATLPHVWNEILETNPPSGTKVISLAFGPGLTIFGAVFECL